MLWTAIQKIIAMSLERDAGAWLGGWFGDMNQTLTSELELEGPLHENYIWEEKHQTMASLKHWQKKIWSQ